MLDQEKDTSVKYVPVAPVNVASGTTLQKVTPVLLETRRTLLQSPTVVKTEEPVSKRESQLEVILVINLCVGN